MNYSPQCPVFHFQGMEAFVGVFLGGGEGGNKEIEEITLWKVFNPK